MTRASTARRIRAVIVGFAALALALTLSACGGTSQTGTISGQLLRVGGPTGTASVPLSGEVTLTSSAGVVTHLSVPATGHFEASIPVGTYKLTGSSPSINDGKLVCVAFPEWVPVRQGSTITRDVGCNIS